MSAMRRRSEPTGALPCAIAYACMAAAVAAALQFAARRSIPIDWGFSFFETFTRDMPWPWAAGGCAVAILGCIAGERARNNGAGFVATVAVTGCLFLALGYVIILLFAVGGYERMLEWLR
jgi:hypothetical protein